MTDPNVERDVFRFVALKPLDAFREAKVVVPHGDIEIPKGFPFDWKPLLTWPITIPKITDPLRKLGVVGVDPAAPKPAGGTDAEKAEAKKKHDAEKAQVVLLARTALLKSALEGGVSSDVRSRAVAVVLGEWLRTEAGKAHLADHVTDKTTWGELAKSFRFSVPRELAPTHVAAEPAPSAEERNDVLNALELPLRALRDDDKLPASLHGALNEKMHSVLHRVGLSPEKHTIRELRAALMPNPKIGFTPGEDWIPPYGGIKIPIPGHHGFPIPKIPLPGTVIPSPGPVAGEITDIHVGELLVVKERLIGYALNEIAHIENVMARELRDRRYRRLRRSETTTESEVEQVLESEKAHQTTERAEIQTEAAESLSTNQKIDIGANVTAHGGFVDVSAHAGFQMDIAKTESSKQTTEFAKEVVDTAVEKSRLRTRELRIVKFVDETEETSQQTTDNREGGKRVRGVYRWLEKRLSLWLHNYGRRTIYTFLLPKPASGFMQNRASLVGAISPPSRPMVVVQQGKPPRPYDPNSGPPSGGKETKVEPLAPHHVRNDNYLDFATFWNVSGTLDPPKDWDAEWIITKSAGNQFTRGEGVGAKGSVAVAFDKLDAGIVCKTVSAVAVLAPSHGTLVISDGDKKVELPLGTPYSVLALAGMDESDATEASAEDGTAQGGAVVAKKVVDLGDNEDGETVTREVSFSASGASSYGFSLTVDAVVTCKYSVEAKLQWQHKICGAVLNEYNRRVSEYEERMASSRAPTAPSASMVEEIVRAELRGRVISVLRAGQAIDLKVAAFLDRAFEWEQMSWRFVSTWSDASSVTGETTGQDKLDAFVNADGARVRMSVKPGYEAAIGQYLGSNRLTVPHDPNAVFDDDLGIVPPPELDEPQFLKEVLVPTTLILLMSAAETKDVSRWEEKNDGTGTKQWIPVVFEEIEPQTLPAPGP